MVCSLYIQQPNLLLINADWVNPTPAEPLPLRNTESDASSSPPSPNFPSRFPSYLRTLQSTFPLGHQPAQCPYSLPSPNLPTEKNEYFREQCSIESHPLKTDDNFHSSATSVVNSIFDEEFGSPSARTAPSSVWSDNTPRLSNILLPETDLNVMPADLIDVRSTHSMTKYQHCGFPMPQNFASSTSEDDVENIIRESVPARFWAKTLASPTFSYSTASSSSSWFNTVSASIYGQPKLHLDSEEMLTLRFGKQTCGILSIKDGPTENPWRMILWPMARESPALRYAINAMTAFHASKENPALRVKGIEHIGLSISLLSQWIGEIPTEVALATILVLAFCESWDLLISTGEEHLRGARGLVRQAMAQYQQRSLSPKSERRLSFLCRTWVYMDVIARLTSLEGDESEDFDTVLTPLCGLSVPNHDIDPLMGCASTLFPLIGRVANLVRRVRKSARNSLLVISQANDLKSAIEVWKAPVMFEAPEDETMEIKHSQRTAEAYRWAILLYLHQAVPEISSQSATKDISTMAKEVLNNLVLVPDTSRAVIIHIFPLLAASCEAVDAEDRKWIESRWQSMMSRMNICNLDKCWEVIREVWDRRISDEAEKQRQRHRAATSKIQKGHMPLKTLKRKYSMCGESMNDADVVGRIKRSAIQSNLSSRSTPLRPGQLKNEHSDVSPGGLDPDMTVRGRLHWAGVMKDWKWEGESHTSCYHFVPADMMQSFLDRGVRYAIKLRVLACVFHPLTYELLLGLPLGAKIRSWPPVRSCCFIARRSGEQRVI